MTTAWARPRGIPSCLPPAPNPDGSPSSAWIRTFKRTRLSLLEAFSRYRLHGGEECDLGPPVLNDARAKLLATKETSFTHPEFSKFAKERGAVLGTKALSASYAEAIFAFFDKFFWGVLYCRTTYGNPSSEDDGNGSWMQQQNPSFNY